MTMNFAVRYSTAMAEVYDQVRNSATTSQARSLAQHSKINSTLGALGNAVDPNPVLGLMDMALMVSLTKEIAEEPMAQEQFGPENAAKILAVLNTHNTIIWEIAATYLTPDQIAQLHRLVKEWRDRHPDQRFAGGARLADFIEDKETAAEDAETPGSIFALVGLDMFNGIDPAVRQMEESRILAERVFFYMQFMPTLISWQTDILYDGLLTQTLAHPEFEKLIDDVSAIAAIAARLTDAIARCSDYCGQLSQTLEKFRTELPQEFASVVKQLNDMIATQREEALKQATVDINQVVTSERDAAFKQANDQVAAQRDAAIQQLNLAATTQQAVIAKNLQDVLNSSIDRLYQRACLVVLMAAGSILAVLLIYRLIVIPLSKRQVRP